MQFSLSFNEALWSAIAVPSRRKLIEVLLSKGETSASRLAQEVPFSRQAVSKHLMVLKSVDLVRDRKTGKELLFSVNPERIGAAAEELSQAARLWDGRLLKIKEIAEARTGRR